MDWDKLRIFHAVAEAGSFTHAGETLGLSQSAVSRQISALEMDLKVPLFHRHARGLLLTEQGDVLMRTVRDVVQKLAATRERLSDSRERPQGELKVTTTVGIGTSWLAPRLGEFMELYPDIQLNVILSDDELDIAMLDGCKIVWLASPKEIKGIEGKVNELVCSIMKLGEPDASGRRSPVDTGETFSLEVDMIIKAAGQMPFASLVEELKIHPAPGETKGKINIKDSATNIPGVFAGGDCVNGGKEVVDAVQAGKDGAASISKFLNLL